MPAPALAGNDGRQNLSQEQANLVSYFAISAACALDFGVLSMGWPTARTEVKITLQIQVLTGDQRPEYRSYFPSEQGK